MSFTRRALFRFIPALPVLAQGIKSEAARIANITASSPDYAAAFPPDMPTVHSTLGSATRLSGRSLVDFLLKRGTPDFKRAELRNNARASRLIDPDLAALRSISPSAMVRIQWRRNEKRLIDALYDSHIHGEQRAQWAHDNNAEWL